ncbi:hypothetical protein DCAR_0832917 [Daucus carota subsp. sativus]|uniref:Uncharacterized protein n=1 Tax=Daucus carota subsp. sativus TaxID=79200 RepID=A0A175YRX5_DAUCS|nr:hypothetical protein DCAR_0832917 [Daucus carota subsp. sativus]
MLKSFPDDNIFKILLLCLALVLCISHKCKSRFIRIKNLLLYLSRQIIKKNYPDGLTRSRYEENGAEGSGDQECSICLSDFKRGDEIMQLSCQHFFHALCLDKWLLSYGHVTCPYCRACLSPSLSLSSSSSSSTTTVLYSESGGEEVISFNFFGSSPSRGRNVWGIM